MEEVRSAAEGYLWCAAHHLLCVARTEGAAQSGEGISLFLVPAREESLTVRSLVTTAGDRQFEVTFNEISVPGESLVGTLHGGWSVVETVLQRATALKCAEMLGGAQAVLDMSVQYAGRRHQFGRPIGSFQAVQHHLADVYRDIEAGRVLTYQALWRVDQGLPAQRHIARAKAKLSAVYPAATRAAHQVHGGVGYHTEYPLEIYYRRALASQVVLGNAGYHEERIAQALGEFAPYHPLHMDEL